MSGGRGETLRIFLADGVSTGVLTAEILNWTGKGLVALLQPTPTVTTTGGAASSRPESLFEMVAGGVKAKALEADGHFVVLKDSQARMGGAPSSTSCKGLRYKLVHDGKLVESGQPNSFTLAENVAFESPSAAAAVVYAGNQNGRMAWRVKGTGQTFKDLQDGQVQGMTPSS